MKTKTTRVINLSVADVTAAIKKYLDVWVGTSFTLNQEIELNFNIFPGDLPFVPSWYFDGATVTIIESEGYTEKEEEEDS